MEFLWQKESTASDALYCNLCAKIEMDPSESALNDVVRNAADRIANANRKENPSSSHCRENGNEKFKERKWDEAIQAYNECLCLAEIDTENVSLGYGNRSACYFELKMYARCLIDIELALNERHCSERLQSKLAQRKANCLERLPSDVIVDKFELKLSYEADKNFPFMANILEIRKNDEFGRHIVAKCDIPVGRTVLIENNFTSYTKPQAIKDVGPIRCFTCCKIASNPIPCSKCPDVMFCDQQCRNGNKIHEMDCGAIYYMLDGGAKDIIHSVLSAVNLFPTIEELMTFVEDAISGDTFEIPESIHDQLSTYRMFLKLWQPLEDKDFVEITYKLYTLIFRLAKVKQLFDTTKKERFLMHLLGHHALILLYNSTQGQMSVMSSLFSHSCAQNIQEMWIDNRTAYMTIRPIKKGEQLFTTYVPDERQKPHKLNHQTEMYEKFGFQCKCEKCENKLADLKPIEQDTRFQEIKDTNFESIFENPVLLQDYHTKCMEVLDKYGHLPWSRQLDYVSKQLGFSMGRFYRIVEVK